MAARFAQLEDGSRQIISLHVPSDMVVLYSLMLPKAPSSLHALANTTIIKVSHDQLRVLAFAHPNLSAALWRDCVADGAIMAQWLVNAGRKSARSRIAHLLAEMAVRYAQIGLFRNGNYPLPITQEQICDVLGLTAVHVNRSIRTLREEGLVQMTRATVEVRDWRALVATGEFTADYLHLPDALADLDDVTLRQVR